MKSSQVTLLRSQWGLAGAWLRICLLLLHYEQIACADESIQLPRATIDGIGPGWRALTGADFSDGNCHPDTWTWNNGVAHCTGEPIGVIRPKQEFTNFERIACWRHLRSGGNSGIFIWTSASSLENLKPGDLPLGGIEVQILDHGFTAQYEASGQTADWFATNGDIFPVGKAKMKPFAPVSPRGDRSFPRKNLSLSVGQWNHYYIRAINAEVRLWVNGE